MADTHTSAVPRILVADDDLAVRETVADALSDAGYEVAFYKPEAPDPKVLERPCDVAVLDMVMPDTDAFILRSAVLQHSPRAQFIFITGYPDREKLERAMDLGVLTFLTKPFTGDHIRYSVMGALRLSSLVPRALAESALKSGDLGFVGKSKAARAVRQRILELAPLDIPVLVTGESGTGKEITSRSVHECSRRAAKVFTPINCAGLSPNLVESELFGHAQGAFTGAARARTGFFEASDGGTVFLDEIGDMPMELQSKLLRVLDRGELTRVGESSVRRVDVRVVSATNRNLEDMVKKGAFRTDLYFRLRGGSIALPPLRERREDIPGLVAHFLGGELLAVAPEALEFMQQLDWPGNVRELAMVVANLKGMSGERVISRETVERLVQISGEGQMVIVPYQDYKQGILDKAENEYFTTLLRLSGGNMSKAADMAGMHRKNLYEKLKQLGIEH